MAPLYRQLAHPVDGLLNVVGEGSARRPSVSSARRASVTPNVLGNRRGAVDFEFPWDEQLYEKLKADNEQELETFAKEEEEAGEKAGDTEVQAAKGKRAEFWARVGDKVPSVAIGRSFYLLTLNYRKKPSPRMRLSSTRLVF